MEWLELNRAIGGLLIAFVVAGSAYYLYTIFDCVRSLITTNVEDDWE